MQLWTFLVSVFFISFSGAMAPGPVSATAIFTGAQNKFSGTLISIGHGIIEFPLIILIMLGMDKIFNIAGFQNIIGLIGGLILIIMAFGLYKDITAKSQVAPSPLDKKPILAGIILTASNPYFLIWWTTIGLTLATKTRQFGNWAFPLFALTHWLCDCFVMTLYSYTSYKGTKLMGKKGQKIILSICAIAVFLFGIKFIADSLLALAG